jgi:hypothetical protein
MEKDGKYFSANPIIASDKSSRIEHESSLLYHLEALRASYWNDVVSSRQRYKPLAL